MWILPLVGYLGSIVGFCFLTLAIASGLYYLSELVEEHTVFAKRLLTKLIYSVIVLQLLLCIVDRFPFKLTLMGVVSHVVYLGNMRRFPFVRLTDPLFLASCVLVLVNHYLWFRHFSAAQQRSYSNMHSYYDQPDVPSFTEIASYFGLCVWLIPFALFVSLSASDNVLPTMGSEDPLRDSSGKSKRQGFVKSIVDTVLGALAEVFRTVGWERTCGVYNMSVDYDNDRIVNPEDERENRYPEIFSNQKAPLGAVLPVRLSCTEAQPAFVPT
ncbi:transmembrane adaptor Erv26 [Colletotrichum fioriniae PJ7]|uniref:Transmembrane adaptor Erv26 n=1 Tax=Colletotrichum fioriniae PJ7 TaxID=1445577 RepID=A0A010QTR6_9PEZI|nr:transmembrane adaptor Erv26 [Colletotrichum fioriniae PJ7]